jgi:hypothetical protein
VVAAYEDGEGSYEEVATIYRVDQRGRAALKGWIKEQPDLTLFELTASDCSGWFAHCGYATP